MSTSSDDVRGYIAGLEAQAKELLRIRAELDKHRRDAFPGQTVTRMETDAEVIARMEVQSKDLADLRAVLDKYRRFGLLPFADLFVLYPTNPKRYSNPFVVETDAEVINRLAAAPRDRSETAAMEGVAFYDETLRPLGVHTAIRDGKRVIETNNLRGKDFAEGRNEGIRVGLRAAALLAGDHDDGDEHDACLDALATKILGTTAEGAASLVEVYDRSKTYHYVLTEVNAAGVETPPSGKPIVWSRPIEGAEKPVGRYFTAVKIPPKPCPLKDCNLPCDDGHKHLVEKTDEPRPLETTTIRGSKPIKLRAGQIWRAKDGTEIVVTIKPPSSLRSRWQLAAEAELTVDTDDTIIDPGGCTLVYDPRGDQ